MAIDGFGASFKKVSGTSTTAIAEVVNISGPKFKGKDIDISNMDSPNGFMEFLPGMVDGGEVELELNYKPSEVNTIYGLFRTTSTYRVQFSDASKWDFTGFVTALDNEAPHDDKVSAKATFKVSGKPTYATS